MIKITINFIIITVVIYASGCDSGNSKSNVIPKPVDTSKLPSPKGDGFVFGCKPTKDLQF